MVVLVCDCVNSGHHQNTISSYSYNKRHKYEKITFVINIYHFIETLKSINWNTSFIKISFVKWFFVNYISFTNLSSANVPFINQFTKNICFINFLFIISIIIFIKTYVLLLCGMLSFPYYLFILYLHFN